MIIDDATVYVVLVMNLMANVTKPFTEQPHHHSQYIVESHRVLMCGIGRMFMREKNIKFKKLRRAKKKKKKNPFFVLSFRQTLRVLTRHLVLPILSKYLLTLKGLFYIVNIKQRQKQSK